MTWTWDPEETPELLARLEKRGVRFRVEGDALEIDAPAGVLNETDRAQIDERRWDIAAWLAGDHSTTVRRLSGGRVAWIPLRPARKRPVAAIQDLGGSFFRDTGGSFFD